MFSAGASHYISGLALERRSIQRPLVHTLAVYALTFLPALALLTVAILQTATPLAYLTKDPLTVAEMAPEECCRIYYGAISNIGILLWCATAAICLFSAIVIWLSHLKTEDARQLASALLVAGLFTGWMTLDDLFLIHENVLPALGIPQKLVYAIYALLTFAYLAFASRMIIRGRLTVFVCAIGFLSLSVGVDIIAISESFTHVLIEDGAKLIGIAAWTSFHIETAMLLLCSLFYGTAQNEQRFRHRLSHAVNSTHLSTVC